MMKPKNIDADTWADGVIHAKCLVDGSEVDPWLVESRASVVMDAVCPIVIQLPSEVLRFELSQAGVAVGDSEWLLGFVRDDLSRNGEVAMNGYLNILRGVLHPRRDSRGLFQRLFGKQTIDPPRWSWCVVDSVGRVGSLITIHGSAKVRSA